MDGVRHFGTGLLVLLLALAAWPVVLVRRIRRRLRGRSRPPRL